MPRAKYVQHKVNHKAESKNGMVWYEMELMNAPLQLIMIQWDTGACGRQEGDLDLELNARSWKSGLGVHQGETIHWPKDHLSIWQGGFDTKECHMKSLCQWQGRVSSFENMLEAQTHDMPKSFESKNIKHKTTVFWAACSEVAGVVFSFHQMSPGQSIRLPIYRRFSPSKMQFKCCLSKLWKTQIVLGKTNASLQHCVSSSNDLWRSSQIQKWTRRAFNMLMICFAWERVRNKNENQSWSEKSWINYVKWMAGKMGRLTKTWHLPRPQSNGIDLKGEPKIYIFLAKFYLITFYAWLPWNTTPENLSQP